MNPRRHQSLSVQQAAQESPTLARLTELSQQSQRFLQVITPMIPATLLQTVKAGPLDGTIWCLIVSGNAPAAKLRQLAPAMAQRLQQAGHDVRAIRLKVLAQPNAGRSTGPTRPPRPR